MLPIAKVKGQHAERNTMFNCLYDYYFLGIKKQRLSDMYSKPLSTINQWITRFEMMGTVERQAAELALRKVDEEERDWLIDLYVEDPMLHLRKAQALFDIEFKKEISPSNVFLILHLAGLTYNVLEKRAIEFRSKDVQRFVKELSIPGLPWCLENLVFLDEVSYHDYDILRKFAYAVDGQRVVHRRYFNQKAREKVRGSLLCFLGINGLLEVYPTQGLFTRKTFVDFCTRFAIDPQSPVRQYPGQYSIWLMDASHLHRDKNIVGYLRSLGIIPFFLPEYSPMYSPMEVIFGIMKDKLKECNVENDIFMDLCEITAELTRQDMTELFNKCGYNRRGFDPAVALGTDLCQFGFDISSHV